MTGWKKLASIFCALSLRLVCVDVTYAASPHLYCTPSFIDFMLPHNITRQCSFVTSQGKGSLKWLMSRRHPQPIDRITLTVQVFPNTPSSRH